MPALAIPVLLAIAYAGLVLAFWSGAEGGFDTLPNVMQLFTQPEIALAGWIHYLAFDLLIGAWEVRTARAERIPFLARRALPCPDVPVRAGRLSGLHRPARRARRHPNRLTRLSESHNDHGRSHGARRVPSTPLTAELFRRHPLFAGGALCLLVLMVPTLFAMALDQRTFLDINVWIKPFKFQVALAIYLGNAGLVRRLAAGARRGKPLASHLLDHRRAGDRRRDGLDPRRRRRSATASHFNSSSPLAAGSTRSWACWRSL